ncbi:adenylate/guanylate cyclase domain-containing protein [Gammaproteobacteria bacterium]|nr:adenylate/guanylate cyclase domain-containing protein [Gammaproteobacteria bacterium]
MSQSSSQRLSAVLMADVAGYTQLVEADTAGTVAAWQLCRDEVIEPAIEEFSGHIVKLTGDGFLAEFPTIQNAVKAALNMQSRLADYPLRFRMGIDLGDIIDDGRDIHGEGVNIAARIESMAPDGGICVTGTVHDAVRNRIDARFSDLGEHIVKHVSSPVRVWQWPAENLSIGAVSKRTTEFRVDSTDTPSIAVLPFANPAGDPEQAEFIDGMTEDLITDLAKVSGLLVVARQSSFAYRGRDIAHTTIASELGVRYLLQGSLRRAGSRIRINAHLIDASTGNEIWADRYDGSLENVFELQDQVSAEVVQALSVKLSRQESSNLQRVHTSNLEAYELFVRARATPYPPIPERIVAAREMFAKVIKLDPCFAGGYAGVSAMMSFAQIWGHSRDPGTIAEAVQMAQTACSVDDSFGWAQVTLGLALLPDNKNAKAIGAIRRAIECEPNDAQAHVYLGFALSLVGEYAESLRAIDHGIRLNPMFSYGPNLNIRGISCILAENYESAVACFGENENQHGPVGPPALSFHAAALYELGRIDEMQQRVDRVLTEFPGFALARWNFFGLIEDPEIRDRLHKQILKAGIPAG